MSDPVTKAAPRDPEHELAQLVDMVPSHLWRLTPDGEPTFFNKRMVDFLGLDVGDIDTSGGSRLQTVIETVIHPDDAARFRDALNRSIVTGESFAMRYRLRRADGVYRWMSSRAEPMRDQGERIIQWYGLCHDIDDQVRAEEGLRRSERQLQQMVDAVPVMIWSATREGKPAFINKRFKDVTGSTLEDNTAPDGSPSMHTIHPDDRDAARQVLTHAFKTGIPCVRRYRQLRRDGSYRWTETRAEPLRDEAGDVLQWYGVSVDIDDELRAQAALRDRERELSLLVNMVPSLLWRLTPDGEPDFFNQRTIDFLGLDAADYDKPGMTRLAATLAQIIHPDDAAGVSEAFDRSFATGERFSMTYRVQRADGVYRWMSGRAEPLRDEEGRIVQWYGLAHDIDDQVRAEEALRRAHDKLARAAQAAGLSELSASIAHEVNQPLAAIVATSHACSRWLSADPPNIERAKLTLERIIRDASSASEVIGRIRALFSQMGKSKSPAGIAEPITQVCRLMSDELAARAIQIETHVDPDLPQVLIDPVQMEQVFVNLIRNAIDALDAAAAGDRLITIRAVPDGENAIRVEVADLGAGMAEPERAFEPFFTTKPNGMGMGLTICQSIIESHNGRLWTAGNRPKGTTLVFTLPIHVKEAA